MLKRYVPRNCSMNRFIVQFNKLLFDRNSEEDRAEFDTTIVNDVRQRAWPIEEHASKVYTSAVYALFRKEVTKSTFYIARENIDKNEFDVVHVKPERRLPWGREKFTVKININEGMYDCECGQYRHFGILCSHAIRVLIQLGVYEIPNAYIKKRWTRSARDILPEKTKGYQKETLCMQSMTFRHTFLYVNAIDVVQNGNKDLIAFDITSKYLKKAQKRLKEYFMLKEKNPRLGDQDDLVRKGTYYTTENDSAADSGCEMEGRTHNTFGASGSSAWMSDSELLRLKAPPSIRAPGRLGDPPQGDFKLLRQEAKEEQL